MENRMTATPGDVAVRGVYSSLHCGVLTITLCNPEVRNAMSQDLMASLLDVLKDAARDGGVKVIVLTGEGDDFCTGADVRAIGSASQKLHETIEEHVDRILGLAAIPELLQTMRKPTIAKIRGNAAGVGLSLAIACDFRFAASDAMFTTAFIRFGGSGDLGAAYFLPRLVGRTKAAELLLLSDKVSAHDALAIGLVDHVFEANELDAETASFAGKISAAAPIAVGYMKQNLAAASNLDLGPYLREEARNAARCFKTEDHSEAVAAFRERRPAIFKGR